MLVGFTSSCKVITLKMQQNYRQLDSILLQKVWHAAYGSAKTLASFSQKILKTHLFSLAYQSGLIVVFVLLLHLRRLLLFTYHPWISTPVSVA